MTIKEKLIAEYTRCYNRWCEIPGSFATERAAEYQKMIEETEKMPDDIDSWIYIRLINEKNGK